MSFSALPKNIAVALQFGVRQVSEDPVNLVLNVLRRLPHRIGQQVASGLVRVPGAGSQALGAQMQGVPELLPAARQLLDRPGNHLWDRLQRRIASEVAISYGEVDYQDKRIAPAVRARTAWDRGALKDALEIAQKNGQRNLARKLAGEIQALEPGWLPSTPSITYIPRGNTALHLLTNSLPHTQSGYTLRSHRLLDAIQKTGRKVSTYTRIGYPVLIGSLAAGQEDSVDSLTYRRILPLSLGKTLPQRLSQTLAYLVREIEKTSGFAVLHTTTNYHNGLVMAALSQATGLPWVYEVRGIMEETWVSRKKSEADRQEAETSERFAKIRAQETRLMLDADHVVTLSQTMKNLLVARGISADKISLLPNAVSEDLFDQNLTSVQARQQLQLAEEGFWVGTVSSLVGYEGIATLLEAVALLRTQGKDVRLLIAGDGLARPSLEKLAVELGIEKHTHFLGRIPQSRASVAHQGLDVFCVPRTNDRVCRSVTPLKPIEAMALRRPVIMSNIPPLAELVDNGITGATGLLTEPDNPQALAKAIEKLMNSADQREELANNGRAFAQTRTWQRNAEILDRIYRQVADTKGRA